MSRMTDAEITKILADNLVYLETGDITKKANLTWANLTRANLTGANLTRANLTWANLTWAILTWANLTGTNLTGANLTGADLTGANLTETDLTRANLTGTNLTGTNLTGTKLPSPTMVLLANWGELSDETTRMAMAYDASCHPDPSKFDDWAEGRSCPYHDVKLERAYNFRERKDLWTPDLKDVKVRPYDLMMAILKEKCILE